MAASSASSFPVSSGLSRGLAFACLSLPPSSLSLSPPRTLFALPAAFTRRPSWRKMSPSLPPPPPPLPHTLSVRAGLDDIVHNQVVVAAFTAGLLGQLVKPFTSALQGKGFNWNKVIMSGGMPSTHSAVIAAASAALAMERGLSDSLFGLSLVYAVIVMYDAQGVRRAVGKQAEVINILTAIKSDSNAAPSSRGKPYTTATSTSWGDTNSELELEPLTKIDSSSRRLHAEATAVSSRRELLSRNSFGSSPNSDKIDVESGVYVRPEELLDVDDAKKKLLQVNVQEAKNMDMSGWRHLPLRESVGHTKGEVLAGGLWGVLIAFILSSLQYLSIN